MRASRACCRHGDGSRDGLKVILRVCPRARGAGSGPMQTYEACSSKAALTLNGLDVSISPCPPYRSDVARPDAVDVSLPQFTMQPTSLQVPSCDRPSEVWSVVWNALVLASIRSISVQICPPGPPCGVRIPQ